MSSTVSTLDELKDAIHSTLNTMDTKERIGAINELRGVIHELSPFHAEPVDYVQWIPMEQVVANDYNPNAVASPEMRLLYVSIREDHFTQPIVSTHDPESRQYIIVDGFHRSRVGREYSDIRERLHGYLPISVIDKPLDERIAATIRHNRARGKHQVDLMGGIVQSLSEQGWPDDAIAKHLGMTYEEIIRLKQTVGIAKAVKYKDYGRAWEVVRDD